MQAIEVAKRYQENAEKALKAVQDKMERLEGVTNILRLTATMARPIAQVSEYVCI